MGIYSRVELLKMGFKTLGKDVRVSTWASIYSPECIELGNHVRIDDFCVLSGAIHIGNFVHVAVYSGLFGGSKGIFVDDFANISSRVCVYALSDDYTGLSMTNPMVPNRYKCVDHGRVEIGKHVIIGTCSTVMHCTSR